MPAGPSELVWAPQARRDLLDIWAYYTDVASSEVAERLLHDIDRAGMRLLRHPLSGRPRDDVSPSLRSVLVPPYAILYRVTEANVEIARVLHTRRNFAAAFSDDG
jgi:toxin ParE1/3/4